MLNLNVFNLKGPPQHPQIKILLTNIAQFHPSCGIITLPFKKKELFLLQIVRWALCLLPRPVYQVIYVFAKVWLISRPRGWSPHVFGSIEICATLLVNFAWWLRGVTFYVKDFMFARRSEFKHFGAIWVEQTDELRTTSLLHNHNLTYDEEQNGNWDLTICTKSVAKTSFPTRTLFKVAPPTTTPTTTSRYQLTINYGQYAIKITSRRRRPSRCHCAESRNPSPR